MKAYRIAAIILPLAVLASCGGEKVKPSTEPVESAISVTPPSGVTAAGGIYRVAYNIVNPVAGEKLSVSVPSSADWILGYTVGDGDVGFELADNLSAERSAVVTLSYKNATSVELALTQPQWDFKDFRVSVKDIEAYGCKAIIEPKEYKGGFFFEVMGKGAVDKYLALETHKLGDMEYGESLYQADLAWLKQLASSNGHPFEHILGMLPNMYSPKAEKQEIPYTDLNYNNDYYLVVYGMEQETGKRTTPISLYQFTTLDREMADVTFSGSASRISTGGAVITIVPSKDDVSYYWTFASSIDMRQHSLNSIMQNMIANLRTDAAENGYTIAEALDKGTVSYTLNNLMEDTEYSIVVWGMDDKGNPTTDPAVAFTFKTEATPVADNCTFTVVPVEIEDMDIKVKVTPTNPNTQYYVAFIDPERTGMKDYTDSQAAQRIINMENSRFETGYYREGVTWEQLLLSDTREIWGRKDLSWTFLPEHEYWIYVFGVAYSKNGKVGNRTTAVTRIEATTGKAQESLMTFNVELVSSDWKTYTVKVTPSNQDEYWMPFMIASSNLETYRYNDGTLMDKEVMAQIEDYYEDEIVYNTYKGTREISGSWTDNPEEHSLLVFGYAGTNTTKLYEYRFTSPEIPMGKSTTADYEYSYEIFRGGDLRALDKTVWSDVSDDECIMVLRIKPTAGAVHWYMGIWAPMEQFNDRVTGKGGFRYLVTLDIQDTHTGSSCVDKTFFRTRPWWYGSSGESWIDPKDGVRLASTPWSLSGMAEDKDGNYGPWKYELLIPVPQPKDEVSGRYQRGYDEAYNFWSGPAALPNTVVYSVKTGKEISPKYSFKGFKTSLD